MALSFEQTGKYTSERHERAVQSGKLTAGQAAKIISKITGEKVSAKQLKQYSTEWHHSGFYSKGMGKTYFFTDEQINNLADNWNQLKAESIQKELKIKAIEDEKRNSIIQGFYFTWDYDYNGSYGKKRNFKVLKFYSGNELNKPINFTSLTFEEYEKAISKQGQKYYGWDEPTKNNIL